MTQKNTVVSQNVGLIATVALRYLDTEYAAFKQRKYDFDHAYAPKGLCWERVDIVREFSSPLEGDEKLTRITSSVLFRSWADRAKEKRRVRVDLTIELREDPFGIIDYKVVSIETVPDLSNQLQPTTDPRGWQEGHPMPSAIYETYGLIPPEVGFDSESMAEIRKHVLGCQICRGSLETEMMCQTTHLSFEDTLRTGSCRP